MLLLLAAIVSGDPRAYEGPRDAPFAESLSEPQQPAVEAPREPATPSLEGDRPTAHEIPHDPVHEPFVPNEPRMPGMGYLDPRVDPPRTGRGLLVAGGILAGTGLVLSTIAVGVFLTQCYDICESYGAIVGSIAAPVPWLFGIGMLGGGMQHRSRMLTARRLEDRRPTKPPRRGVFGAGLALTIIGTGAMVGTWWALGFNAIAQLGGGPLAVAGALMAGSARGRRRAIRNHVVVAPVLTPATTMLSITTRW